jgi:uridine kinase
MPLDEKGEIDYDSLHALDLKQIRTDLNALLDGKSVDIPHYDFKTGLQEPSGRSLRLGKGQVIIVEGIHGMNPALASEVTREQPFKIYISTLTQLNLDVINRIPTSTVRLIRRIVRDCYFRYSSARQTIVKWPRVRQGEEKNIFPFQEEADVMFNSSLVYEMSILKGYVEPLLLDIDENDPAYTRARMLLHFTSNFLYISPEHVPLTSILREFIGGSGFQY